VKIKLLKSKIHRATVTEANLDYVGSISVDKNLMDAAGLFEFERVHVLNVTNGQRLITYAIAAPPGSGKICINGAAAHLVSKGNLVILVSYCSVDVEVCAKFKPTIVHVNQENKLLE